MASLQRRLLGLLSKGRTSDVEFVVGERAESFRVHRAILASGSSVFETMFFGPLRQKSPVLVPDAHPTAFRILIKYLYSDAVLLEEECDAWETAYVSKKYMVRGLFEACEDFLLRSVQLGLENVLPTLEEASFLEMRRLEKHCLGFVARNARKIFSSKSLVRASRSVFDLVLSLDLLDICSECDVIEAVWLWGEEQCRAAGLAPSPHNVRARTKDLLRRVRFLALGVRELAQVLDRCRILDTEDKMALLWNMAMPRPEGAPLELPADICTVARTRSIGHSTSKIRFPGQYVYDGSMTLFPIENHLLRAEITVTGSPVTVIGAVIAFKPVPCYCDRRLEIAITADNRSSGSESGVRSCLEATEGGDGGQGEVRRKLLLDSHVVIEERQEAWLTVGVSGEGVRLMQCAEETARFDLGKSVVSVRFDRQGNKLFPVKELIVVE